MDTPRRYGTAFIVAGAFCGALFVIPIAITFVTSFHDAPAMGVVGNRWTLGNYAHLFRDDYFAGVLLTTLELGVVTAAVATTVAYPLAYFIVRSSSRGVKVILALIVAPMFISSVVRALGWILFLGEFGPLNYTLTSIGLLAHPLKLTYNFAGVVIAVVHWVFPFVVLILVAAIHSVKPMLEEAAQDLGAGVWQTFARVTLPLTMPGVISAFLLALSATVSGYTTMVLMGGGRVKVASCAESSRARRY
jgi:putative spermidine/putrescine transport system permease protein